MIKAKALITKNILALAGGALYSAPAPAFVTNFRGRGTLFVGGELVFAYAADGANPVVGQVGK